MGCAGSWWGDADGFIKAEDFQILEPLRSQAVTGDGSLVAVVDNAAT